jgi:hypothetical protein
MAKRTTKTLKKIQELGLEGKVDPKYLAFQEATAKRKEGVLIRIPDKESQKNAKQYISQLLSLSKIKIPNIDLKTLFLIAADVRDEMLAKNRKLTFTEIDEIVEKYSTPAKTNTKKKKSETPLLDRAKEIVAEMEKDKKRNNLKTNNEANKCGFKGNIKYMSYVESPKSDYILIRIRSRDNDKLLTYKIMIDGISKEDKLKAFEIASIIRDFILENDREPTAEDYKVAVESLNKKSTISDESKTETTPIGPDNILTEIKSPANDVANELVENLNFSKKKSFWQKIKSFFTGN